jgi:hypothetical protein
VNVTAIHLYRNGTHVRVAIEVGGRWVRVIEERIEDAFSHIVEESGMRAASTDGCNCGAENYNRRKPPVEMTHALNCASRAASTRPEAAQASAARPTTRGRADLPVWAQVVFDQLRAAALALPEPRPAASVVFTDAQGNEVDRWPLTSGTYAQASEANTSGAKE